MAKLSEHTPKADMKPDFWVYEDDATNHVRIHRGDCPYCNHGRGLHNPKERKGDNRWYPDRTAQPNGFQSYAEAQAKANETGRPWKNGPICHPERKP